MSSTTPEPQHGHNQNPHALQIADQSGAIPTSTAARAKRRIVALEEELENMKQDRGTKQRKTTYYVAQGRAIRRMVVLYTSLEDLIAENDRRYEELPESSTVTTACSAVTSHWRRSCRGCTSSLRNSTLMTAKTCEKRCALSMKVFYTMYLSVTSQLKKGADAARSDDTSTLKDLIAAWVNQDFRPSSLLQADDKQSRGFSHDICGRLLCPAEWDWDNDLVKVGIRDRTSEYIVSENSWPLFLYEGYTVNGNNLEQGLFKSKILVQAFKALFTSPSSAKEADGDGDGADIIENNRRARRQLNQTKVKTCVRFALSGVSSWRTVDGDFDYEAFWNNAVDFFEDCPGPAAQRRVTNLLEWWTRKIFGKNHREDLTQDVVSQMSVTALAKQRMALEDAAFDSD
ncbi:hypothetical protein EDD22DRAFT_777165 [Suillus occidentalis]|nr:hypothetical protein EDD22DRAFT_777165 [Suillus occidentalis]